MTAMNADASSRLSMCKSRKDNESQQLSIESLPVSKMGAASRSTDLPGVQNRAAVADNSKIDNMVPLPSDFSPSPYSVILGRGKKCFGSTGNRRLQVTVSMFLERYSAAATRDEKSEIVGIIKKTVEAACPGGRGAFIRFLHGRWWEVEDSLAREKIGATLRDALHEKYQSSTKAKLEKRRTRNLKRKLQRQGLTMEPQDNGALNDLENNMKKSTDYAANGKLEYGYRQVQDVSRSTSDDRLQYFGYSGPIDSKTTLKNSNNEATAYAQPVPNQLWPSMPAIGFSDGDDDDSWNST